MAVSAGELRLVGFLMATAYAVMTIEGFWPAWRAGWKSKGAVRTSREVPGVLESIWVGTQGLTVVALAFSFFWPSAIIDLPLSLLPYSNFPLSLVGGGLFIAGAGLTWFALAHLGAQFAVAIEMREGGRLVTSGPYARVRHPIYTGVFLMIGGLAVALAHPALGIYATVAFAIGNLRARLEEGMLAHDSLLGPEYVAYLRRTGRFIPRKR